MPLKLLIKWKNLITNFKKRKWSVIFLVRGKQRHNSKLFYQEIQVDYTKEDPVPDRSVYF